MEYSEHHWRLKSADGYYVQADSILARLGAQESAELFDENDNPDIKVAFYGAVLGCQLIVEPVLTPKNDREKWAAANRRALSP